MNSPRAALPALAGYSGQLYVRFCARFFAGFLCLPACIPQASARQPLQVHYVEKPNSSPAPRGLGGNAGTAFDTKPALGSEGTPSVPPRLISYLGWQPRPSAGQPAFAQDMATRAFDATLRSQRDALLLPGIAFALVRAGKPDYIGCVGLEDGAQGAVPIAVDAATAFALSPDAAMALPNSLLPKKDRLEAKEMATLRRARGHLVDLARAEMQACTKVSPEGQTDAWRWLAARDLGPWLTHVLSQCDSGPPPGWQRVANTEASGWMLPALGAPGFSAHAEVHCQRRAAYAVLVNAQTALGEQALIRALRQSATDYLPFLAYLPPAPSPASPPEPSSSPDGGKPSSSASSG